jgi:hypothetical protein
MLQFLLISLSQSFISKRSLRLSSKKERKRRKRKEERKNKKKRDDGKER